MSAMPGRISFSEGAGRSSLSVAGSLRKDEEEKEEEEGGGEEEDPSALLLPSTFLGAAQAVSGRGFCRAEGAASVAPPCRANEEEEEDEEQASRYFRLYSEAAARRRRCAGLALRGRRPFRVAAREEDHDA